MGDSTRRSAGVGRFVRILASIGCALLLIACQQPNEPGVTASKTPIPVALDQITPEYIAGLPIKDAETLWHNIGLRTQEEVEGACRLGLKSAYQGCMREKLMTAYGNDPLLERHCPQIFSYECILFGADAIVTARMAGVEPESIIDWSNIQVSLDRAESAIDTRIEQECAPEKVKDNGACVIGRRTALFGGSPEAAQSCMQKGLADRQYCVALIRTIMLDGGALRRLLPSA